MVDLDVTVTIRLNPEKLETSPIQDATRQWLHDAVQYREFRYVRGQRHFSGSYWSATMGAHVGYESRLELGSLQIADFDPSVTAILSQPFLLAGPDAGERRTHVPDFLLTLADGRLCVIDVKSRDQLNEPRVRAQFAWTRAVAEQRGWEYRVESEANSVFLRNVRFLAGYRRSFQFDPDELSSAMGLLVSPTSLGGAVRTVERVVGSQEYARGVVLHLLWSQKLTTDLSEPLQSTSLVAAGVR